MAAEAQSDRVLIDPTADAELACHGITTVPIVGKDTLSAVERRYWELVPADEGGIRLDFLREDRALKRRLADLLDEMWAEVVPQVFEVHYPVYSSFVVKHPGEDSALFLHRDLSVEDERHGRSYAMWMPFTDTGPDVQNGPLAFIPGSREIRHGGFGPNAAVHFHPYTHRLAERLVPMEVAAGSALVYDARMLHASTPNRTDSPRLAVGCLLARRDRPPVQVYATGRRHRRVHTVDRDYFIEHGPADLRHGMPAGYPVIDEYDEDPPIEAADILGALADPDATREVCVPDDVRRRIGSVGPLPGGTVRATSHREDVSLPAGATDLARSVAGLTVRSAQGEVRSRSFGPLARWRRVPPGLPAAEVPRTAMSVAAGLLVVEPGGRACLQVPDRRWTGMRLRVVEAPPVTAGVATRDGAAEAVLGLELHLPSGPVDLWNDGPGPLVITLERAVEQRGRSASPPPDGSPGWWRRAVRPAP